MERLVLAEKKRPDLKLITRVKEVLLDGGVIVYPTDTVYGFGVDALDEEAVERLFTLKSRDPKKPLLVMMADIQMAQEYVLFTPEAKRLLDTFLPGPLTLVLPRNPDAPERFFPEAVTIGIRIPKDSFCSALSRALLHPITSTSVNISGAESLVDPDDIETMFGDRINLLVDGGVRNNPPSTIVDFSGEIPTVVREGAIKKELLGL